MRRVSMTFGVAVCTTIPSLTGRAHDSLRPRRPSTSTTQARQRPALPVLGW